VFGAGGGTSSYREIEETDVILLWGSNARETHPIMFHHMLTGMRAPCVLAWLALRSPEPWQRHQADHS